MPVLAVWTCPLTPFFIAPPAHPTLDGSSCGSVLSGVHSRALDGPTAAARLSIAFLSNKKGTHEKDMGEGPLPRGDQEARRLASPGVANAAAN